MAPLRELVKTWLKISSSEVYKLTFVILYFYELGVTHSDLGLDSNKSQY